MSNIPIISEEGPKPVGPYSPAILAGDFLFISGQIPLKKNGELVVDDFEAEVRQVFYNIECLLLEAKLTWKNLVKVKVFTTDLSRFDQINSIYNQFVQSPFPARAAIEVSKLPKGARIEMEAVAYVK